MSRLLSGDDPDDWLPEDEGVAAEPLTLEEMDDRWIEFYSSRIHAQIARLLEEDSDLEE